MIVYIGGFSFPYGDAVAKRVLGIGKSFALGGYQARFIGYSNSIDRNKISEDCTFDGFTYCSLHKPQSAKEHYDILTDLKLVKQRLVQWNSIEKIQSVILPGTKCAIFANSIVSYCKKNGIKVIADSMDWLDNHTGNFVFDAVKNADVSFELKYVNKRADGIIAISAYLADYYRSKKTIIVPPLSPYVNLIKEEARYEEKRIHLVYAGIPCRLGKPLLNKSDAKDRLDLVVDYLYEAYLDDIDFCLDVYGMTKEQYNQVFPDQMKKTDELVEKGKISFKGYTDSEKVKEAVSKADYTILLREKNKITTAGFPTKIAESIALGTPVITTRTSDIDRYVTDGIEGFFIDIEHETEAVSKIKKILRGDRTMIVSLRDNAKRNISFSPETYSKKLCEFVENL